MAAKTESTVATLEYSQPPILQILLIGFHHQKGSVIEYAYPSLDRFGCPSSTSSSLTDQLPDQWKPLPHIALPDGCHNYEEGHVSFCLPSVVHEQQVVYGVSCYRQIDSNELNPSSPSYNEVTRSTIQKCICAICKWPVFGFLRDKLSIMIQAFLDSKDFTDQSLIDKTYSSLNGVLNMEHAFRVSCNTNQLQELVLNHKHRILQIFKTILLEKKILIYGASATVVSDMITSVVSLFPLYYKHLIDISLAPDEQGLPLCILPHQNGFQPYISLQQIHLLTDKGMDGSGFIMGVANPLYYKQSRQYCQACYVIESKTLEIYDLDLSKELSLSSADLRYCSFLFETVQKNKTENDGDGGGDDDGDDWVKEQFKKYLVSLLSTSVSGDSPSFDDFNFDFTKSFCQTSMYSKWMEAKCEIKAEPRHVCEGDLSLSDLKHHLLFQADEYGLNKIVNSEQVERIVQTTGNLLDVTKSKVSSLWATTSDTFINWWGNTGSDDETDDN